MKAYGLCAVNDKNEILHAVLFATFPNDVTFDEIQKELYETVEFDTTYHKDNWTLRYMSESEIEATEKMMNEEIGEGTFDNLMQQLFEEESKYEDKD